jgi:CubicO group peptidase (beta-lactamase class C family)
VSKSFIAIGILKLASDGKIRLDDKIAKYIKDAPPDWDAVRVRHLLAHTWGIPDYLAVPGFSFRQD